MKRRREGNELENTVNVTILQRAWSRPNDQNYTVLVPRTSRIALCIFHLRLLLLSHSSEKHAGVLAASSSLPPILLASSSFAIWRHKSASYSSIRSSSVMIWDGARLHVNFGLSSICSADAAVDSSYSQQMEVGDVDDVDEAVVDADAASKAASSPPASSSRSSTSSLLDDDVRVRVRDDGGGPHPPDAEPDEEANR